MQSLTAAEDDDEEEAEEDHDIFGYIKNKNNSEDTICTNIIWNFQPSLWPWPQKSNPLRRL